MRAMHKIALSAALATAMLAAPAFASAGPGQKKKDRDPEKIFNKLDTNSDAKLSVEELKGKSKKDAAKVEKRFGKLDKDGDKAITLEEFKAGFARQKSK